MVVFHVLVCCGIFKTTVESFDISNFVPVNSSDVKVLVGRQAEQLVAPLLQRMHAARARKQQMEEAEEEDQSHPPPPVFRDENKNIFFDLWVLRGRENRLMGDHEGRLCASVQSSPEVKDTLDLELWRFLSGLLQVRRDEMEVVRSQSNDMARRVIVKGRSLTVEECQQRLHANMRPFSLEVVAEAGAEESAKLDEMFSHDEVKAQQEAETSPEVSAEDLHPAWRPNYVKNPALLDRILQDLLPNQEILVRGRLLKRNRPNFVARPLLEDYQGSKTLKVRRKILEGLHDGESDRAKEFPAGPRMRVPARIPGLSVVDTLSRDGTRVLSRRVLAPLFQNETHDFVDELDYTEVHYKTSM